MTITDTADTRVALFQIKSDADRERQSRRPAGNPDDWRCAVCNGPLKDPDSCLWVEVDVEGLLPAEGDTIEEAASLGAFPVGPSCVRHLPKHVR